MEHSGSEPQSLVHACSLTACGCRRGQDPIVAGIEARIAEWTRLPADHGEPIQVSGAESTTSDSCPSKPTPRLHGELWKGYEAEVRVSGGHAVLAYLYTAHRTLCNLRGGRTWFRS